MIPPFGTADAARYPWGPTAGYRQHPAKPMARGGPFPKSKKNPKTKKTGSIYTIDTPSGGLLVSLKSI